MNTLRYITTNLSKSTLTNTIQYQRNISRNISTIVKDDASKQNVKGCCGMDSKNIEVPATAGIIIKDEKIIHKMKGKSSLEPEKSKCNDIDHKKPSWVDKKSACVEKKTLSDIWDNGETYLWRECTQGHIQTSCQRCLYKGKKNRYFHAI